MSTFLNYIKEINLFSESDTVEHSNEFSIKSEDNGFDSNSNPKPKSKVKFTEQIETQTQINPDNNKNEDVDKDKDNKKTNKKDKTILNYYDSIKINFFNTYGSTNIATTFLTILFMTLKIIYKNLTNK